MHWPLLFAALTHMPQLTNLLIQSGLSEEAVFWLLSLPVVITLAIIARQVFGIKGFGIATPSLFGFVLVGLGIQTGIIIFALAFAAILILKSLLAKVRLLYLPRLGVIIIGAVLTILITLPFLPYKENANFSLAGLTLVVLALLLEQFTALLVERGLRKAAALIVETLMLSTVVFFVLTWDILRNFVLAYPVFVATGTIALNLLLGKWTGLRVSEYIRFKNIIFK